MGITTDTVHFSVKKFESFCGLKNISAKLTTDIHEVTCKRCLDKFKTSMAQKYKNGENIKNEYLTFIPDKIKRKK